VRCVYGRESLEYGARRNDVASLLEVAQMYEWGLYGAAVDTAKALRMYETAASLHDPQVWMCAVYVRAC
jgi:TPR repeat protein